MFYDGTLRVDNFSNKCFTNVEVAFLKFTLGTSVYRFVCIECRPNTNVRVFISIFLCYYQMMRQEIEFVFWMNLVCGSRLPCLLKKVVEF